MADKPKVLIVDDEPFNVDYLQQELEEADYDTLSASNGQQALDLVGRHAPDVLLLDIMMPVMDGFEVLRRLKADPATRAIPVIVISASNNLESVVRGIELGAEDYLPKPFEPVLLHARLRTCLEKKRLHDLEQRYLRALQREMDIARDIQQGFLPPELPRVSGWEIAAYFRAAREVAGDFYDAFTLPDGSLVAVIGDVCGKGVGAALFMTLFRSLVRATFTTGLLGESGTLGTAQRLERVASFTNRYVADVHGDANMFATMFIGAFAPQGGRLAYLNCGHELPLWLQAGGAVTRLQPGGPAVGIVPQAVFGPREIELAEGDLLFAFTDGVPDALDPGGASFDRARLLACIADGERHPAAVIARLAAELERFAAGTEQFDDITMIAVRRTAPPA